MGSGMEFGPQPRGGDVDSGVLPDRPFRCFPLTEAGFFERPHVETVELDQITWYLSVQVAHILWGPLRYLTDRLAPIR